MISYMLLFRYDVRFQEGMECGGAYIKLLSEADSLDLKEFHDKTPYTVMFGPDKCGNDLKLHFIFRYENPKTKEFYDEESWLGYSLRCWSVDLHPRVYATSI